MLTVGRRGRLYVVTEANYGVHPGHAATDAVRHINFVPSWDPKNRASTGEKKDSPGRHVTGRFDRRESASWTLEALLRPSGTLNTLPEASEILEAAFGSKTNVTNATTASAGSTVNGCTVASAGTLAAGDGVLITCPDGKKRVRRLTSVVGAVLAWAPALPTGQQPATGAAVKGCITYKLTSALAISLALSHYHKNSDGSAGFKRGILGAMVDRLTLAFDANEEARLTASGPAKTQTTGTTPAVPAGFTTVGNQPPSGLTGEVLINGAAYKSLKLSAELTNGQFLRNEDFGTSAASEGFRSQYRGIAIGLDARVEDETVLYDNAETGTNVDVFLQQGLTEGNIVAIDLPQVEFKVPDTDDPDEVPTWPFKGMALESADGANDEMFLFLA